MLGFSAPCHRLQPKFGGGLSMHCLPSLHRYCAGTMPWGNPGEHHDFEPQRHDDGCIEVIGFTMTSLVSRCCCPL